MDWGLHADIHVIPLKAYTYVEEEHWSVPSYPLLSSIKFTDVIVRSLSNTSPWTYLSVVPLAWCHNDIKHDIFFHFKVWNSLNANMNIVNHWRTWTPRGVHLLHMRRLSTSTLSYFLLIHSAQLQTNFRCIILNCILLEWKT